MRTPRVPCSKEPPIPNVHHWIHNLILQKQRIPREENPINSIAVQNNSIFIRNPNGEAKKMRNEAETAKFTPYEGNSALLFGGLYFPDPEICKLYRNPQIHHEKLNSLKPTNIPEQEFTTTHKFPRRLIISPKLANSR